MFTLRIDIFAMVWPHGRSRRYENSLITILFLQLGYGLLGLDVGAVPSALLRTRISS
jgi:hypothetical protein